VFLKALLYFHKRVFTSKKPKNQSLKDEKLFCDTFTTPFFSHILFEAVFFKFKTSLITRITSDECFIEFVLTAKKEVRHLRQRLLPQPALQRPRVALAGHHARQDEHGGDRSGVDFTNMFTCSNYASRSQKCKKTFKLLVLFCAFWICECKSFASKLDEIDPMVQLDVKQ